MRRLASIFAVAAILAMLFPWPAQASQPVPVTVQAGSCPDWACVNTARQGIQTVDRMCLDPGKCKYTANSPNPGDLKVVVTSSRSYLWWNVHRPVYYYPMNSSDVIILNCPTIAVSTVQLTDNYAQIQAIVGNNAGIDKCTIRVVKVTWDIIP